MTAVRYKRIWIKFLVILFLMVVGFATAWYAYLAYESRVHEPKERIEEKKLPEGEEII